jgi:hypothetical protein
LPLITYTMECMVAPASACILHLLLPMMGRYSLVPYGLNLVLHFFNFRFFPPAFFCICFQISSLISVFLTPLSTRSLTFLAGACLPWSIMAISTLAKSSLTWSVWLALTCSSTTLLTDSASLSVSTCSVSLSTALTEAFPLPDLVHAFDPL